MNFFHKILHRFSKNTKGENLSPNNLTIIKELRRINAQLRDLDGIFNQISDQDLTEGLIYQYNSLESRYRYLLRLAKVSDTVCTVPHLEMERECYPEYTISKE